MQSLVRLLQALAPALYHSSRDVRLTALALVIANLAPLLGVIFAGWDPAELLYLYWLESLIIGVYTLLAMIGTFVLSTEKGWPRLGKLALTLFTAAFFTVHYGGFNFGHGIFLIVMDALMQMMLSEGMSLEAGGDFGGSTEPLDSVGKIFESGIFPFSLVTYVFERTGIVPSLLFTKASIFPAVVLLVLSHGVSFVKHDLLSGNLKTTPPMEFMMRPYGRIFLMHIFIILGFFMLLAGMIFLGRWASVPLTVLWIGMKLQADLKAHAKIHALSSM